MLQTSCHQPSSLRLEYMRKRACTFQQDCSHVLDGAVSNELVAAQACIVQQPRSPPLDMGNLCERHYVWPDAKKDSGLRTHEAECIQWVRLMACMQDLTQLVSCL